MKKLLYVLTGALLLAGLFAGCEKPEKETEQANSTIKGVVTDKETGTLLSGVMIELQPVGKQIQTAEDGTYIFENLKAGTYTLKAQKDDYADYIKKEIQLVADQVTTWDIEMEDPFIEFQITDEIGTIIEEMGCGVESRFILKNVGNIAGEWRMEWEADWITEISPTSGNLAAGDTETITIKKKLLEADKETVLTVKTDQKDLHLKIVSKGFVGIELVYVEGGTFEMGATEEQGDDAMDNEKPVRTVKLDGYHIGKYEVTQAQWRAVMGTSLKEQRDKTNTEDGLYGEGDDYPMYYVSWMDAQEFCKKLSEATGKKYVLPTEAQWEYAARGGNKSQHYRYAGSDDLDEVAWYWENSYGDLGESHPDYGTHLVGTKKANELGIYDMSGNVVEWCLDWYGKYDEKDMENPQGPASGSYRMDRGGGWGLIAKVCRVSNRHYQKPGNRYSYLGFRVVCLP